MNLLVTGAWAEAPQYIPEIEKRHNVLFLQYEKDGLPCTSDWVEGVICNGLFLFHPIEQFINLRYIQLTSAGLDRVPVGYVNEHGIIIRNARGVYSIPMAEYALSGVLNLYKRNSFFMESQKKHEWKKQRNLRELYGKKVCVIGCGSVGTECAARFCAMGCVVLGIDSVVKEHKNFFCIYNTDSIKEVLKKSDIVIVTLPLTEQTRNLFDKGLLAAIKDDAVLVNISRGALIDTAALLDELKTGRISAVIDVFEEEPLSESSELWDMENVIITPHNSFVGEGNGQRISSMIMGNLQEVKV